MRSHGIASLEVETYQRGIENHFSTWKSTSTVIKTTRRSFRLESSLHASTDKRFIEDVRTPTFMTTQRERPSAPSVKEKSSVLLGDLLLGLDAGHAMPHSSCKYYRGSQCRNGFGYCGRWDLLCFQRPALEPQISHLNMYR
jgi:hypothetical protein